MSKSDPIPRFDQRPGALEATRELSPTVMVTPSLFGWAVTILTDSAEIELTPADARQLLIRLQQAIDFCDMAR